MSKNLSLLRIIVAILIVNIVGIALKIFVLDTFIIIFGFRFHISLLLPLAFVLQKGSIDLLKRNLVKPEFRRWGGIITILVFVNIIFISSLLLLGKIQLGDPEYFYEFGISSIIDYPIYLIWNSSHLILFFFFFRHLSEYFNNNIYLCFVVIVLLFVYEFIPMEKNVINYQTLASFLLLALIASLILKYFNNVYLFVLFIFSLLWINLLAFGSTSQVLIQILFAAKYNKWEGFFTSDNQITGFLIPTNLLLVLISLIILISLRKSEHADSD